MKLAPRQQQILALLSSGKTYKEVGEYLGISIDTVRTYIRRLYSKLNAHSIAEAVVNYELARKGEPLPVREYQRPEGGEPKVVIPDYDHFGKIRKND